MGGKSCENFSFIRYFRTIWNISKEMRARKFRDKIVEGII